MAEYLYKARDAAGQMKTGEITAENESSAAELLAQHKLILTRLSVKEEKAFDVEQLVNVLNPVKTKDRVIFTRQLGTMIKSGLPIVQALHVLSEQTTNPKFKQMISDMAASIEGGSSFSGALAKYPKVFDKVYVNLVKAGEASGKLEETLNRLATQQEKSYRLAGKIKGAMLYPAFVFLALIAATIIMLIVVIPPLKTIFEDAGAQLPLATQILIWLSDAVLAYWYLFLLGTVILVAAARWYLSTLGGKSVLDQLKLKAPLFGGLFQKIYISRLTRTLAALFGSGVSILEALDITADSVGNQVYAKALRDASKQVESGAPLSQPIKANPIFPPLVPQMISVGEQTGKMDQVLTKLADFYEEEVDTLTKNISTLLEPIIMVVMGIGVGGLLIAILMPIYSLGTVIK